MDWYEAEVTNLIATHQQRANPEPSIAFYGSSSIRMWDTLADDFPDLPTLNLGFGGSTLAACAHFYERLVGPVSLRSLILYAGDNDLGDGRSPADVLDSLRKLLDSVDRLHPNLRLGVISLKPSPHRWGIVERFRETNALLKAEIESRPECFWIDIFPAMLGPAGEPQAELYAVDGLHLSTAGYRVWTNLLNEQRHRFT